MVYTREKPLPNINPWSSNLKKPKFFQDFFALRKTRISSRIKNKATELNLNDSINMTI